MRFDDPHESMQNRPMIYALVKQMTIATRIVQATQLHHLGARTFSRGEALKKAVGDIRPVLIILDWDDCEAESFKFLKEMLQNADLKDVPVIGYASEQKAAVRSEAHRAGCHRVFTKTEFQQTLSSIVMRYAP